MFESDSKNDRTECCICFNEVNLSEVINLSNVSEELITSGKEITSYKGCNVQCCRKTYHISCLNEWFKTKQSCPMCRENITIDSSIFPDYIVRRYPIDYTSFGFYDRIDITIINTNDWHWHYPYTHYQLRGRPVRDTSNLTPVEISSDEIAMNTNDQQLGDDRIGQMEIDTLRIDNTTPGLIRARDEQVRMRVIRDTSNLPPVEITRTNGGELISSIEVPQPLNVDFDGDELTFNEPTVTHIRTFQSQTFHSWISTRCSTLNFNIENSSPMIRRSDRNRSYELESVCLQFLRVDLPYYNTEIINYIRFPDIIISNLRKYLEQSIKKFRNNQKSSILFFNLISPFLFSTVKTTKNKIIKTNNFQKVVKMVKQK